MTSLRARAIALIAHAHALPAGEDPSLVEPLRIAAASMMDRHMLCEHCARAAHEANGVYSAATKDPPSPAWGDLTEAQRDGAIAAAQHALDGGTPEASHELWMASRLAEGWTLGEAKDFAAKTSPCLVPYAELPEAQRKKDALFQGVVREMGRALGWQS